LEIIKEGLSPLQYEVFIYQLSGLNQAKIAELTGKRSGVISTIVWNNPRRIKNLFKNYKINNNSIIKYKYKLIDNQLNTEFDCDTQQEIAEKSGYALSTIKNLFSKFNENNSFIFAMKRYKVIRY